MLQKKAITEVPQNSPGFYSNIFLVLKASGGGSAYKYARPSRLYPKQKEIRAGLDSGSPVSRNPFTSGLRGSFPSRVQSLGDSCSRTPSILPSCTNLFSSVPGDGVTRLGLRSYPSGSFVPETPSTLFSLIRSDRPVNATSSIRSTGPCQPSTALAGPTFSYLGNPHPHISGGFHDFYIRLHSGVGRSHGGLPDFGYLDPYRPQAPYHLSGAQGGSLCPKALGPSVMIATDNSTVVSYINKQGGTHSPTLLRLTIKLLLWLEAQNILVARHIPGCLNVIADQLSRPNQPISTEWSLHPEIVKRIFGLWGTPEVDMFATVSNSHLPVSNSGATSANGGCSVSGLAGEVNVLVSSIPSAQKSHSEAPVHPGGRGNSHSPLVAETVVVSTPTSSLCETPLGLSLTWRSSVPAGSEVCLGRKVVPSARMEALMRHYKAAGFSDEVSRLATAPRRPSSNRMYDDQWLRFARWNFMR